MRWPSHAWLLVLAPLTAGCAEQMSVLERGSPSLGVVNPPEFWPPPQGTSIWTSEPAGGGTLGEAAEHIAETLRGAGYVNEEWYPIGVEYAHGFAVTTRLERTKEDGTPMPTPERWSSAYPHPATLRWLEGASDVSLPAPGRSRVFFVAFTDLALGHVPHRAPRWNELTVMAASSLPAMKFPAGRRVPRGYRVGVSVYEYASESPGGEATFVASEGMGAAVEVERAGLGGLVPAAR